MNTINSRTLRHTYLTGFAPNRRQIVAGLFVGGLVPLALVYIADGGYTAVALIAAQLFLLCAWAAAIGAGIYGIEHANNAVALAERLHTSREQQHTAIVRAASNDRRNGPSSYLLAHRIADTAGIRANTPAAEQLLELTLRSTGSDQTVIAQLHDHMAAAGPDATIRALEAVVQTNGTADHKHKVGLYHLT
jgi:hypothetical protein